MRTTGLVVASTLVGIFAVWLLLSGLGGGRPSLARTAASLRRPRADARHAIDAPVDRVGRAVRDALPVEVTPRTRCALRTIERTPERHIGYLVAALIGLVMPTLAVIVAAGIGGVERPVNLAVPAAVGVIAAGLAPLLVHGRAMERAADLHLSLRHQLSAFVDMVTMLLAGNAGHEGALGQAAQAGDGRLFRELRRRMREAGATGRSFIDALDPVADDFDLPELTQIAATGRLAAAEGAPVARSLSAKCATLRSTLAADQEAEARVRTDKVTPPLVGMTVLFMAVIIFPALDL